MKTTTTKRTATARADSLQEVGMPRERVDDYEPGLDDDDDDTCGMCGGDGMIMLSEAGPSEWGEDCFSEVDRPIACPECRERARYEAFRKQQEAKRHTDEKAHA